TTTVVQRGYSYDALGRPLTRTQSRQGGTRNDSFTHNDRSELTAATLGTDAYAYAYDNIGNRLTAQEAEEQTAYTANNLNQYTAIQEGEAEAFAPTYDADGNQTLVKTSTGIWTVTYNAANRPVVFENEATGTVVECSYDSSGRRATKKVTVNGTVTLHQRYIYRGYLQIACCDLTRTAHPCLWLITWDPTEEVATRPLAIQKDGTWYTYGRDLTKNICEVFGSDGYIKTAYTYTPYGAVTASGSVVQPIQWSSEYNDTELGLVYYNYRHYNPADGRWTGRERVEETESAFNRYDYSGNRTESVYDSLGMMSISACETVLKQVQEKPGKLSKTIRLILKELEQHDKSIKDKPREKRCMPKFKCYCNEGDTRFGAYNSNTGRISINAGKFDSSARMIATIQHELIHARQNCFIERVKSCDGSICRELGANRDSGFCQIPSNREQGESVRQCIVRKASYSAAKACKKNRKNPKEMGELRNKIDLMYDKCKSGYYINY
ncbi:MAG: hypothetical protein MSQ05_08030, partial [Akkermansia sp.]|nr:hypothetical protein [Akkermansia sp.]